MGLQIPTRTYFATAANTPSIFDGASPENQLALANAGLANQKLAAAQTFSGGFPTDANGQPDYMGAAKMLFQKGDFSDATGLAQAAVSQRAIAQGLAAADSLAAGNPTQGGAAPGSAPAASPTSPTASSAGANPEVVNYITSAAQARGIAPNVALGAAAGEGLRGFDPNGKPNLGDGGSSAGPYQLHYGGVAGGGNSSPGLGDDFTAATGLDARDPSTWKAQVDFALDHAAKYGWGAFHGAAKVGIGEWTGIGQAPTQGSGAAAPTQVAQNGASDASDTSDAAASSTHPYAPVAPASQPPAPQQPAAGPDAAQSSTQVAGNPGAPMPIVPVAPAPNPTNVPGQQTAGMIDPTMGGLLTGAWVGNPGGYVSALRAQAVRLGTLGNTAAAAAYDKQADAVERGIERNNIVTPTMKDYQVAVQQGFQGTQMDFQRALEVQKLAAQGDPTALRAVGQHAAAEAAGSAQGKAPYELNKVQATPGGPTTYQSTADIAASPTPVVATQPAVFAQDQETLGKTLSAIPDQMAQRQIAQERIGAMSKLLETFQTGAGADQKAAAIAGVRALGFNIPDSATANPAAVEQFSKNAVANIFSQAKSLGGKILVSELAGLQKSNANPNMQPGSNAAILAQQKGLLDWQEAHDQALLNWSQQPANQNAYTAAPFEAQWMQANPPSAYVAKAKLDIAPLGVPVPPPQQRVVGQRYAVPGKGVFRYMGNGQWSAN